MAKSRIEIDFELIPQDGTVLNILNSLSTTSLDESFQLIRTGNGESTIGNTAADSAFEYVNALTLDYNSGGLYTISRIDTLVTIEAVQDNVVFSVSSNTTGGRVTTVITNETVAPAFSIDAVTFSEADSDPCNYVKVNVTTSELAPTVNTPSPIINNTLNPYSFDWLRETGIIIDCETATESASASVNLPALLSVGSTTVTIIGTPTGATITTTHTSTFLLNLEYSIDGSTIWQTSNTFQGIALGSHTVNVRDQLGCSISIPFEVVSFEPDISVTTPFAYVAKENSIRYKVNQVWDNCTIYKTEKNTLSCEELVENAYPFAHKFQTCDLITTQFLSNLETLEANVINEDGTKDSLAITQRSNNLDIKDKRDARYYQLDDNQTGVYFLSGDFYDYDTGIATGESYELNGTLPNYGAKGNYIFLDGIGWYEIVNIEYDDDKEVDVLVIDYAYTGVESDIIVSSNYNLENFEIYEFDVDMATYANSTIQVEILMTDTDFDSINYLSEEISIQERWYDTLELRWYNPVDTLIYYSTGIRGKARVDFELFQAGNESDLEIHKTDTTVIMIDSESYETMTLELSSVPTGIKRQLTKVGLHKQFYINNVQYVSNSVPESEPINFTNQHVLRFNLTKTGDIFNSEFDGGVFSSGFDGDGNVIEGGDLSGLLKINNGYLKIN